VSDLRTELIEAIDQAEWAWLMPHVERDVVVLLAPSLDLVEVGLAIVNDNTIAVQQWLDDGLLHKPSLEQTAAWNQTVNKRFTALIVQPYILAQEH
jgi:hypothetical protein